MDLPTQGPPPAQHTPAPGAAASSGCAGTGPDRALAPSEPCAVRPRPTPATRLLRLCASSESASVPEHDVFSVHPAVACVGHPAFHGRAMPARRRATLFALPPHNSRASCFHSLAIVNICVHASVAAGAPRGGAARG